MFISLLQKGQTLVVGAAGASGFLPILVSLLINLIRQKRMNAIKIKFTTAVKKLAP